MCGKKDFMLAAKKKFYYVVVVIEESHNMDFITIQRLIEKLQAHEEKINHIQVDLRAQSFFPNTIQKRSKMVWDISKKVDDVDKAEK